MPLINCKTNLMLSWSAYCLLSADAAANQTTTFAITDKKLLVPVMNLSRQKSPKLLQQLKSGFKGTTRWNKYQSKYSTQEQNQYLDY